MDLTSTRPAYTAALLCDRILNLEPLRPRSQDQARAALIVLSIQYSAQRWQKRTVPRISSIDWHLLPAVEDSKASDAALQLCIVYEEGAMPSSIVHHWFSHLKNGNFHSKDGLHSGRSTECDEQQLN
ncbi:hypothetical protein AVEN_110614-1 [Araneus ventricosus]|uniref:Mos1 transposase HTH domain-containing protein n=1 Tax=Araneus ventricosus TaxID=182803 RepID=A0A4Y2ATX1_ARAVE|nr:hypothetical protein AVEN_110614-1 [Araneus ventricosus]